MWSGHILNLSHLSRCKMIFVFPQWQVIPNYFPLVYLAIYLLPWTVLIHVAKHWLFKPICLSTCVCDTWGDQETLGGQFSSILLRQGQLSFLLLPSQILQANEASNFWEMDSPVCSPLTLGVLGLQMSGAQHFLLGGHPACATSALPYQLTIFPAPQTRSYCL